MHTLSDPRLREPGAAAGVSWQDVACAWLLALLVVATLLV